ncbi:cellulase family glycosylhydrolase [Ramlibacter tataouinensis]|uniref:glycoside hydrolase family 5 protein n=1 Tax=Ramlibacter tataouinensis TaxID=94132 RepID=UPI0022F3AAFD|nr:cellulase family glycosylhydrolase [Ramlibacter tataouinensis]WBY03674.1 cellulase family glycosylhydrolase [Ramlibacter tataouinensis]
MQRREFHKGAISVAVLTLLGAVGCGGGGGGSDSAAAPGPASGVGPGGDSGVQPDASAVAPVGRIGSNLSGMEWADGVRASDATAPNLDFTVPRAAEVRWLATRGFGKNRLPFMWELLQPMLVDTSANAQARALIGEPGALHAGYAGYIDTVLDAHAAAGTRCILDCHNYCRYRDFRFQPDGSVIGLTQPADPLRRAYTTDPSQVFTRIMATAPGATLSPAAFADFWRRLAQRWGSHPGFGGYGLMNEPHDMPLPGQVTDSTPVGGVGEDLLIWPVFARAAIDAIRAVDPAGTIYLSGNAWGGAMNIGPALNPAWPLAGSNLVYEVHSYVDAFNNGNGFDWELEVAKNFTAGFGVGPMTLDTGVNRMRIATDWAHAHGTVVALTETGMPVDDERWHEAFRRMIDHTWANGWEIQTWIGGSHWAARNHGINHVPGWHQHRTLEPMVAGPIKAAAGIDQADLFDAGPGAAAGGAAVTITVFARGNLAAPAALTVSSDAGGSFSKTALLIPAGPNGQDSFAFTPAPDSVATLSYQAASGRQVPPPRQVYSIADPVAQAATSLENAARAILARHSAALWDFADGFTDYLLGRPAQDGEPVRAVADSGFASGVGNPMEMLNWMNQDSANSGPRQPPVLRRTGHPHADLTGAGATGLWCRKAIPGPTYPNPSNQAPWNLQDDHFVLAAIGLPLAGAGGVVFRAGVVGLPGGSVELALANGQPQASWSGGGGGTLTLSAPAPAVGATHVLALVGGPGGQQLRVDGAVAATGNAAPGAGPVGDLLIGWGDPLQPQTRTFGGHVHAVVTGRGRPSDAELGVLERWLAGRAAG